MAVMEEALLLVVYCLSVGGLVEPVATQRLGAQAVVPRPPQYQLQAEPAQVWLLDLTLGGREIREYPVLLITAGLAVILLTGLTASGEEAEEAEAGVRLTLPHTPVVVLSTNRPPGLALRLAPTEDSGRAAAVGAPDNQWQLRAGTAVLPAAVVAEIPLLILWRQVALVGMAGPASLALRLGKGDTHARSNY